MHFLLTGPPWVRYRTRTDLLGEQESHPDVHLVRQAMLAHTQVQELIAELKSWPSSVLTSHKSAGHPIHKLTFLADIGLTKNDPGIDIIITNIISHQSTEGPFQVLMNVPKHFGGSGQDTWTWALCDAPLILYSLIKFGLSEDSKVHKAIDKLSSLSRDNGWPCSVAPEMGKFRGPGRKEDPCPYATLIMLKLLALLPQWRHGCECHIGAESLLNLWERRQTQHPYMFYMGTDFCKLKAPFIWYDILHVVDVLSQFPWVHDDKRFLQMWYLIRSKADSQNAYTPESIWQAWKEWDFDKKNPSPWLTLLVWRIDKKLEMRKNKNLLMM